MWIWIAAASGALAIAAGAFGAHGLKARVNEDLLAVWQTASHYHLAHSIVLLALALFALSTGKSVRLPAGLIGAGMTIFSGSLYVLVLTDLRWLGAITPIGGVLLIAGWLSLVALAR